MQLKRRYCLVSCMLEFLVSWYWNGPSSYGLPVIKQTSLRTNVLWQRLNWHLAGPEKRSRKTDEMSHFPFWACTKHSSGNQRLWPRQLKGLDTSHLRGEGTRHSVSPATVWLQTLIFLGTVAFKEVQQRSWCCFCCKHTDQVPITKTCLLYNS